MNSGLFKAVIIAVNYRGADSTIKFLESVSRLEQFEAVKISIVDNASGDGSAEKIRRKISGMVNVELLESPVNRGYFGGANQALQHYIDSGNRPDWVIVCNNDILFHDPQFLTRLMERDPAEAGVLAPAIIARLTGIDANPFVHRRPTRWRVLRYRFWLSNYYLTWFQQWLAPYVRVLRHHLYFWRPKPKVGVCTSIYAPHGSFIIFSRAFFEAGGFIDDGSFLYAEEFRVAEICLRLGVPVLHDPGLKVWHDDHQTTGRNLSRSIYAHQKEGLQYALRKYMAE